MIGDDYDLPVLVGFDGLVPITENDLAVPPPREVEALFQRDAAKKGIRPTDYRIMDFGRGALVGKLRKRGWDARGVDVDPRFVKSGEMLNSQSDALPIVCVAGPDGRSPFPDGYFDALISEEVLEHVSDIDAVAAEIGRLLKPGGICFHQFPARFVIMEDHYRLPLVHWLPKNGLRRVAMRALIGMGFKTRLPDTLPASKKAEIIFHYSCNRTYYRPRRRIALAFEAAGIKLDWVTMVRNRAIGRFSRMGAPGFLARVPGPIWCYNTFINCMPIGTKN